jgi:cellulose biosynthesis protein BcsQ
MFNGTRVIALLNNKGGVTKTTTAFNLIQNYRRSGRVVVPVDFDQQSNLSKMLPDITQTSLKADELKDLEADYVIVDTGPTFRQDHIKLMLESDVILTPFQLDRMDIEQTTTLLDTAAALNVIDKVKLIIVHSGHHTQMYKALRPAIENIAKEYGVEILCEMRRNQYVPKANLHAKTVFEIQSPPDVRKEWKELFKKLSDVFKSKKDSDLITRNSQKASKGEVQSCQRS